MLWIMESAELTIEMVVVGTEFSYRAPARERVLMW